MLQQNIYLFVSPTDHWRFERSEEENFPQSHDTSTSFYQFCGLHNGRDSMSTPSKTLG